MQINGSAWEMRKVPEITPEDYSDEDYYPLLCRLPYELQIKHLTHIERERFSSEEAAEYLEHILAERTEATTKTLISDSHLKDIIERQQADFLTKIETSVFTDPTNQLGAGLTARVKRMIIQENNKELDLAVKYLITPTAKTLSAAAEHDMIREVERIQTVEKLEEDSHLQHIGVPHPYFHHKTEKIQCYGMQLIDGSDLEVALNDIDQEAMDIPRLQMLADLDYEAIASEIDVFYKRMHTYCLHGDIKPKNLMFDQSGKFYLIDFGQSVLTMDISENEREQFDNLIEDEITSTKDIIRGLITKARRQLAHKLS